MPRELLNTLYVQTPGAYVRLEGDALKVEADGEKLLQIPLHHLNAIMLFGATGISSPALTRFVADDRTISFFDGGGRFKARVVGPVSGNVLLRQAQYAAQCDITRTAEIAQSIVAGKIHNQRQVLARSSRDCKSSEGREHLRSIVDSLAKLLLVLSEQRDIANVRGIEGQAAALYFEGIPDMLTVTTTDFAFKNRSRRPLRDRVNALLSFLYALLTTDCIAACEGVGLDPQFGFLHVLRPGRPALALDLMEEFRPLVVDRLAFTLINRRQIRPEHFDVREDAGESVLLNAEGRKIIISAYQERKQESVTYPLLKEKVPQGLLPHLQSRLLARHLRGDLVAYLPFIASL